MVNIPYRLKGQRVILEQNVGLTTPIVLGDIMYIYIYSLLCLVPFTSAYVYILDIHIYQEK